MTDVVRVGVIGTGIGVEHIEVMRQLPHAEVVAVCSAQRDRAEEVAARFGIPIATTDYRRLLEPDVDAVVVATPPALHAPMTIDAISAGKHVFCEKPMAASLAEARAMREAARRAGVVHMINYQLRFAPAYQRAAELTHEGYLGRLALADARITINPVDYLHAPGWSSSKAAWFTDAAQRGGLLGSSAGPHLADFLWWLGGPIVEVAARVAVTRPSITLADGTEVDGITSEDAFLILVRFASGALGTIRGIPIAHHRGGFALDLYGVDGTLEIDGSRLRGATSADDRPAEIPLPENAPRDRTVIATRFIEAILNGGSAPAPNFDDGLATQAVLDAAVDAASTGQWVPVALEEG